MLKTTANPGGCDEVSMGSRRYAADRSQFLKDLSAASRRNRAGGQVRKGCVIVLAAGSRPAQKRLRSIKVFSETDLTKDLSEFDVPTLIIHGDDDQIVPIADSALLSSKLIKNAQLKIYKGGSHGICSTRKDEVNADLLAFLKA